MINESYAVLRIVTLSLPVLKLDDYRARPIVSSPKQNNVTSGRSSRKLILQRERTVAIEIQMELIKAGRGKSLREAWKRIFPSGCFLVTKSPSDQLKLTNQGWKVRANSSPELSDFKNHREKRDAML